MHIIKPVWLTHGGKLAFLSSSEPRRASSTGPLGYNCSIRITSVVN